jgi:esterase/lipase
MQSRRRWIAGSVIALIAFAVLGPRTAVGIPDTNSVAAQVPHDVHVLPGWLADREQRAGVRDTFVAARIRFANEAARTTYSVVYLHGFTGSRQESSPVPESVAEALGANLFEARLHGHGLPSDSMGTITAKSLLADALEALTIGGRLGDSVVVIGLSTGGTLASWLATLPPTERAPIKAIVLVSPNFGPRDPIAKVLLLPWARVLLPRLMPEIIIDDTPPANEEIARMGSARIPMRAVFPMQALVRFVASLPLGSYDAPTLALYNIADPVVEAAETEAWLTRLAAAGVSVEREQVTPEAEESPHVLAGRLLSPSKVEQVVDRILRFVR